MIQQENSPIVTNAEIRKDIFSINSLFFSFVFICVRCSVRAVARGNADAASWLVWSYLELKMHLDIIRIFFFLSSMAHAKKKLFQIHGGEKSLILLFKFKG